jgi:hypothetical protein
MAARERKHPLKNRTGHNPYNTKTYKVMVPKSKYSKSNREKPVKVRVISRAHVPKERVNLKEKLLKKKA